MVKSLMSLIFIASSLYSKEVFFQENILNYFNKENPYYYNEVGQEYVKKAQEQFYRGALDTQLSAKYDDKKYPVTKGTYQEVKVSKPIYNGMEFSLSYRNAQGTQEYNNIKTAKEGEILSSVKIPIVSFLQNTSKNNITIQRAKLQTKSTKELSKDNLLELYYQISQVYFELLLQKEMLQSEKLLLKKAQKNYQYVVESIKVGKLPQVALLEVKSQILNRQQRKISVENKFIQAKNKFLQYIGLNEQSFNRAFVLPILEEEKQTNLSLETLYKKAIEYRPKLKKIFYDQKELALQQNYNNLAKYPKLDLKLYGVYDMQYKEGYKVSVNFNLPLERQKYKGKSQALRKELLLLQNLEQKTLRVLRVTLKNILQNIKVVEESISLFKQEFTLVKELEKVECKKYQAGVSTLMLLNQREINTLQIQQRMLKAYYNLKILKAKLQREVGKVNFGGDVRD